MPRYVAFFRGLNIGRPPSPDRDTLEKAFLSAGAPFACSFHAHGNVVFDAKNYSAAAKVMQQTRATLNTIGFEQPGFLRPLSRLQTLLELAPFADQQPDGYHDRCVTWLPTGTAVALPTFPLVFPRDDATLLGADARGLLDLPFDRMDQQVRLQWADLRRVGGDLRLTLTRRS